MAYTIEIKTEADVSKLKEAFDELLNTRQELIGLGKDATDVENKIRDMAISVQQSLRRIATPDATQSAALNISRTAEAALVKFTDASINAGHAGESGSIATGTSRASAFDPTAGLAGSPALPTEEPAASGIGDNFKVTKQEHINLLDKEIASTQAAIDKKRLYGQATEEEEQKLEKLMTLRFSEDAEKVDRAAREKKEAEDKKKIQAEQAEAAAKDEKARAKEIEEKEKLQAENEKQLASIRAFVPVKMEDLKMLDAEIARNTKIIQQKQLLGQSTDVEAAKLKALMDARNSSAAKGVEAANKPGYFDSAWQDLTTRVPIVGKIAAFATNPLSLLTSGLVAAGIEMKKGIEQFRQMEDASTRLNAQLAQSGKFSEKYVDQLQDLGQAMEDTTHVAKQKWISVFAELTKMGADSTNIDKYSIAVKNLAGFLGGDVEQAARLFGRAMNGHTEMLTRYGLVVDHTATKQEQLNSIMKQLAEKGAGQLEARTLTLTGAMDNLHLSTSNFLEGVGTFIAQQSGMTGWFNSLAESVKDMTYLLPEGTKGIMTMTNNVPSLKDVLDKAGDAINGVAGETETLADALEDGASGFDKMASHAAAATKKIQHEIKQIEEAHKNAEAAIKRSTEVSLSHLELLQKKLGAMGQTPMAKQIFQEEEQRQKLNEQSKIISDKMAEEQEKLKGARAAAAEAAKNVSGDQKNLNESMAKLEGEAKKRGIDQSHFTASEQLAELTKQRNAMQAESQQTEAAINQSYRQEAFGLSFDYEGRRKQEHAFQAQVQSIADLDKRIANLKEYKEIENKVNKEVEQRNAHLAAQTAVLKENEEIEKKAIEALKGLNAQIAILGDKIQSYKLDEKSGRADAEKEQREKGLKPQTAKGLGITTTPLLPAPQPADIKGVGKSEAVPRQAEKEYKDFAKDLKEAREAKEKADKELEHQRFLAEGSKDPAAIKALQDAKTRADAANAEVERLKSFTGEMAGRPAVLAEGAEEQKKREEQQRIQAAERAKRDRQRRDYEERSRGGTLDQRRDRFRQFNEEQEKQKREREAAAAEAEQASQSTAEETVASMKRIIRLSETIMGGQEDTNRRLESLEERANRIRENT